MTRPLRIEYPGALYHVTARGDKRSSIFLDDEDRKAWLDVVALVCERFNFSVHAYCLMTDHYHLMLETADGNLSQGMRQLNGIYTQQFNRRHDLVGHVLQGRYKAILVQKESHLLELSRYIVLNPVRAGMVGTAQDWQWSSHRCMLGEVKRPPWLNTNWLLGQFASLDDRAVAAYAKFVKEGAGMNSPLRSVQHQLILGDERFIAQHKGQDPSKGKAGVPKVQRRVHALTLEQYQQRFPDRDEAMSRAYWSTVFTMRQIARHFGVEYSTVSRAVRHFEAQANAWEKEQVSAQPVLQWGL